MTQQREAIAFLLVICFFPPLYRNSGSFPGVFEAFFLLNPWTLFSLNLFFPILWERHQNLPPLPFETLRFCLSCCIFRWLNCWLLFSFFIGWVVFHLTGPALVISSGCLGPYFALSKFFPLGFCIFSPHPWVNRSQFPQFLLQNSIPLSTPQVSIKHLYMDNLCSLYMLQRNKPFLSYKQSYVPNFSLYIAFTCTLF